MRYIVLFLLASTTAAFAQSAAPVTPQAVAPVQTAPVVDWHTIGTPVDDDRKPMVDRMVYLNTDVMDKNVPVNQAVLSQGDVAEWTSEHLGQIMTLNGKQYDTQVYQNRLIFTPTGYADYVVYLKNTNLGAYLKTNSYKLASFVDGAPRVNTQGIQQISNVDTYTWQITANLVLSYLDYRNQVPAGLVKDKKDNSRIMIQAKIDLIRIPGQSNNNIVAINHLSFGPVPAATESLDPAPSDE